MQIVLAGGSGFLGQPLIASLRAAGHQVTQLVRRPATDPDQLRWNPAEPVRLPDHTDAVINLCGVGVGDHRWTDDYKKLLYSSRLDPTATLATAVAKQDVPLLLNASGVGYYGETGDREVTEASPAGDDFLARLSVRWEAATEPAALAGARVALLRTGMVLHSDGGFLKAQLLPFKMGVGGKLGNGRQWVPWMSREDWLGAVHHILRTEQLAGPVNMVGPKPVRNDEFTKAFGAQLHRPTLLPIPKVAIQALYGAFAEEAFRSIRALPAALNSAGYVFRQRTVTAGLAAAFPTKDQLTP